MALAGFFTLLGLGGLLHALTTSTRRHRTEFATLRSLGFLRRQVAWAVVVFVLTIVGVATLVGVPVGIVAGRLAWSAAVDDVGIVVTSSVPMAVVALAAAVAAGAGLVLAAGPAWRAARRAPVEMLRVE